jgi:hypothetical protein
LTLRCAKTTRGTYFCPTTLEPLTSEKEPALIQNSARCVFVRRDPDGLVLILRPLNLGALKYLMPRMSDKNQRPIVRIEEKPGSGQ